MSTLTGRGPELRQIAAAMNSAYSGRPSAFAIEGEPGIGKTRLLDEAAAIAASTKWMTLECRCGPFDEDRPFTPLLAGLEDLLAEHEAALPVELVDAIGHLRKAATVQFDASDAVGPELRGDRLATVLVESLHELARLQPLLVIFDDCQWIDDASAQVLWGLVRRRRLSRLLVLSAFRRQQSAPKTVTADRLRQSMTSQGASWLVLGPLNAGDARELAESVLGAVLTKPELHMLADAAGNPLFINELFRPGRSSAQTNPSNFGEEGVPSSLRRIVLSRLDELPSSTAALLHTAAVSGMQLDIHELAVVHGIEEDEVLASLAPALAQGLLIERGFDLVFQHAIVQGIIADSDPFVVRQKRHLTIARSLVGTGCRPERVAEHFWRSEISGDREAIEAMTRAATTVRPLSLVATLSWLERAFSRCTDQVVSVDVALEITGVLILLGRFTEAEAWCERLSRETTEPDAQIRLRFTLASLATMAGRARNEEAQGHIEWILDRLAAEDPRRVELLGWRAMLLMFAGDVVAASTVSNEALAIPISDRWADSRSRAFEARAFVHLFAGDLQAAQSDALYATTLFSSDQRTFSSLMMPHFTRAMTSLVNEPVSVVRSVLEEGFEVCDRAGHDLARLHLEPLMAIAHFVDGGFAASRRVLEAVFSRSNDWRSAGITLPTATGLLGVLTLFDGDEATAVRLADQSLEELRVGGSQAGSADFAVWCVAVIKEAMGDPALAQVMLETVWNMLAKHASLLTTAPDLVRLSLPTKPEFAADVTRIALRRADRSAGRLDCASATACLGHLQGDPELLDQAADLYESIGWTFPGLRTRWFAAQLHPAASRWSDLAQRVATFESPWLSARVAAEAPRGVATSFPAVSSGPGALTRAERAVVELVAEGMTNKEIAARLFVSHRTVDSHVSHALTKLNLTSRVQLALWFAEQ